MSRITTENEEMAYRIYISDTLQLQAEGKYITKRYADIILEESINENEEEEQTAEEIAISVINKYNLKIGEQ